MISFDFISLNLKFIKSCFYYYKGYNYQPLSAAFSVTSRCNLRCTYCGSYRLDDPDLSIPEIQQVLKKLKGMGVARLGITGGEPLLRKDIGNIFLEAKKLNFYLTCNSNLTLYSSQDKNFDLLDLVFTSLDGDLIQHEENRGREHYAKVLEAIEDITCRRKKKLVAICVVTGEKLPAYHYLLDLARQLKFEVYFQWSCFGSSLTQNVSKVSLSNEEIRSFWKSLSRLKKSGQPIANTYLSLKKIAAWENYSEIFLQRSQSSLSCVAGKGHVYVDSRGEFYPCAFSKGRVEGISYRSENLSGDAIIGNIPCHDCIVGPHMEFTLLYKNPISTGLDLLISYLVRRIKR